MECVLCYVKNGICIFPNYTNGLFWNVNEICKWNMIYIFGIGNKTTHGFSGFRPSMEDILDRRGSLLESICSELSYSEHSSFWTTWKIRDCRDKTGTQFLDCDYQVVVYQNSLWLMNFSIKDFIIRIQKKNTIISENNINIFFQ